MLLTVALSTITQVPDKVNVLFFKVVCRRFTIFQCFIFKFFSIKILVIFVTRIENFARFDDTLLLLCFRTKYLFLLVN